VIWSRPQPRQSRHSPRRKQTRL